MGFHFFLSYIFVNMNYPLIAHKKLNFCILLKKLISGNSELSFLHGNNWTDTCILQLAKIPASLFCVPSCISHAFLIFGGILVCDFVFNFPIEISFIQEIIFLICSPIASAKENPNLAHEVKLSYLPNKGDFEST